MSTRRVLGFSSDREEQSVNIADGFFARKIVKAIDGNDSEIKAEAVKRINADLTLALIRATESKNYESSNRDTLEAQRALGRVHAAMKKLKIDEQPKMYIMKLLLEAYSVSEGRRPLSSEGVPSIFSHYSAIRDLSIENGSRYDKELGPYNRFLH